MVDQKLVGAYYEATLWLIDQIKHHGWHHWSADFLCEYARARYAYEFSDSLSPLILDEMLRQHPHLKRWFKEEAGGESTPAMREGRTLTNLALVALASAEPAAALETTFRDASGRTTGMSKRHPNP